MQPGQGKGRQHLPQVLAQFGPGSLATLADPQDPQVPSVPVARAPPADTGEGGAEKASILPSGAPLAADPGPLQRCPPLTAHPGGGGGVVLLAPALQPGTDRGHVSRSQSQ